MVCKSLACLSLTRFSGESDFFALLDIWFPDKKPLPTAFLVDTSEEALLLPDWLKLRMIRSEVSRLVDAGTTSYIAATLTMNMFYLFTNTRYFFPPSVARLGASAAAPVCSVLWHPSVQHEQTPAVLGPGRLSRSTDPGAEHHG